MEEASSRGFIADVLVIGALMASMWLLTEGEVERSRGEQVEMEAATESPKPDLRSGRSEPQG